MRTPSTLALAAVIALLCAGTASADPDRITRGEAEAVFKARTGGGSAIHNNGHGQGVPADADTRVAIRPFYPDARHYCVDDWHVITLALFVDELNDGVGSMQEAKAMLDPTTMDFTLDGVPLETTRNPVKAFLDEALTDGKAYLTSEGRLVGPGELVVGSHVVSVTLEDPTIGTETLSSQFFVDASGTGACV
jgi:hypothetical protein